MSSPTVSGHADLDCESLLKTRSERASRSRAKFISARRTVEKVRGNMRCFSSQVAKDTRQRKRRALASARRSSLTLCLGIALQRPDEAGLKGTCATRVRYESEMAPGGSARGPEKSGTWCRCISPARLGARKRGRRNERPRPLVILSAVKKPLSSRDTLNETGRSHAQLRM
jgi:hypothetical protein